MHRTIVDGDEHVTRLETDQCRRTARGDVGDNDTSVALAPQHAVLELVPGRTRGDVRRAETEQHSDHDQRHRRSRPPAPHRRDSPTNPMTRTSHPMKWSPKQRQKMGSVAPLLFSPARAPALPIRSSELDRHASEHTLGRPHDQRFVVDRRLAQFFLEEIRDRHEHLQLAFVKFRNGSA